jgi:hypothetical protein
LCENPLAFSIKTINEKHYIITEISFDTKNKKGRVMKIGFRIPSVTKRIAARTSVQRVIRHNFGFKAPKGMGAGLLILKKLCTIECIPVLLVVV